MSDGLDFIQRDGVSISLEVYETNRFSTADLKREMASLFRSSGITVTLHLTLLSRGFLDYGDTPLNSSFLRVLARVWLVSGGGRACAPICPGTPRCPGGGQWFRRGGETFRPFPARGFRRGGF